MEKEYVILMMGDGGQASQTTRGNADPKTGKSDD
jgi:hypothetical protein